MTGADKSILALDYGSKRIGIASAGFIAKLPQPLMTLDNNVDSIDKLTMLAKKENAAIIVVGLPRNLQNLDTEQTREVMHFKEMLEDQISIPIYFQDEALSSREAETLLRSKGRTFSKGDIDAMAATYILDDFIKDKPELIK